MDRQKLVSDSLLRLADFVSTTSADLQAKFQSLSSSNSPSNSPADSPSSTSTTTTANVSAKSPKHLQTLITEVIRPAVQLCTTHVDWMRAFESTMIVANYVVSEENHASTESVRTLARLEHEHKFQRKLWFHTY